MRVTPVLFATLCLLASPTTAAPAKNVRADAESAFVAARFDEADQAFASILAKQARDTLALFRRGQIALYSNRLADAQAHLEKARAAGATPIRVSALLGEVAYRQDDYATAAARLESTGHDARARKLQSFAGAHPWRIEGPDSVAIPMIQVDPLPLISMSINGKGPYFFLIDTGGGELAVDTELADTLGLERFGDEMGTFAGGRRSNVAQSRVSAVGIGPLTIHDVPIGLLETRKFSPIAFGRRVAGVVGTVFLYHFRATLDYPHAQLLLVRRGPVGTPAGAMEVPFWMAGDHFMVAHGTVDSSRTKTWFVDSGMAGAAFTGPASTLIDAGIPLPDTSKAGSGIGGGGSVRAAMFPVRRVTLGPAEASQLLGFFGVFPPTLERAFGFRIDGIVSHSFLRAWAVTLDFERMRLVLAK